MDGVLSREAVLLRRIEALEARVRIVEEGLLGAVDPLMLLGFSVSEAQMVALLSKRDSVTTDALYYLTYGDDGDVVRKVIEVRMSHIRKKLRRFGVTIETHIGAGYSMGGASKMRLGVCVARAVAERDGYDGQADLAGSIELGLRVIRDRVAAGGPGWEPKLRRGVGLHGNS